MATVGDLPHAVRKAIVELGFSPTDDITPAQANWAVGDFEHDQRVSFFVRGTAQHGTVVVGHGDILIYFPSKTGGRPPTVLTAKGISTWAAKIDPADRTTPPQWPANIRDAETVQTLAQSPRFAEARAVIAGLDTYTLAGSLFTRLKGLADPEAFVQFTAALLTAPSYPDFCRLLGQPADATMQALYRTRWTRLAHTLFQSIEAHVTHRRTTDGDGTVEFSEATIAALERCLQVVGKQYRPSKEDDRRIHTYLLDLCQHIGHGKTRLLTALITSCDPRVLSRQGFLSLRRSVEFHYALDHSPALRQQFAQLLQQETTTTGHVDQWRLMKTRVSPADLRFLMHHFQSLSPNRLRSVAGEFAEIWVQLTRSNFTPAVRTLSTEIAAFNTWLVLHLPNDVAVNIAQELVLVPSVEIAQWAGQILNDPAVPVEQQLGPLRQYLSMPELRGDKLSSAATHVLQDIVTTAPAESGPFFEQSTVITDGLKAIAHSAAHLSTEERAYIGVLIRDEVQRVRQGRHVANLSYGAIDKYIKLVEAARQLGVPFAEIGESYAELEPRFFGYMNNRLPSGRIGNAYLSETGFLGSDAQGRKDNLQQTITTDRVYLQSRGLTPAMVAAPLHAIRNYFFEVQTGGGGLRFEMQINGTPYRVQQVGGPSTQSCPFMDTTDNSQPDLLITNLRTKETLFFAGVVAHLISEHGFFEGVHAGQFGGQPPESYRIPPEKLIHFFAIRPDRFSAVPLAITD